MAKSQIVNALLIYLEEHSDVKEAFDEAFKKASESGILKKYEISLLNDYLTMYDDLLKWTPSENMTGTMVYERLCLFYYILDLPPLVEFQIHSPSDEGNIWLAQWLIDYSKEIGTFMNEPESITEESVASFYTNPLYHMADYPVPPGGWNNFNEFFTRHIDPALRPISGPENNNVIISPADCSYGGSWDIDDNCGLEIYCKGVPWKIAELLDTPDYAEQFKGGKFAHSFLEFHDYHRQHAPVDGTIIDARVIPGICYLGVSVETDGDNQKLVARRRLASSSDSEAKGVSSGYQILQSRGIVMIDNPALGLVGVIIVGMAQASSVILSVTPGSVVSKGEEIAYCQMGGSDVIMLFEKKANVTLPDLSSPPSRFKMGMQIATANTNAAS